MRKKMFQLRILAYILQMTFVFTVFENKLLDSNALIVLACWENYLFFQHMCVLNKTIKKVHYVK